MRHNGLTVVRGDRAEVPPVRPLIRPANEATLSFLLGESVKLARGLKDPTLLWLLHKSAERAKGGEAAGVLDHALAVSVALPKPRKAPMPEHTPAASRAATDTALGAELSPSQVNRFLGCSASYFYKHGSGLPERPTPPRIRGSVVHRLVAAFFRSKRDGTRVDATPADVFAEESAGAGLAADAAADLAKQSAELAGLYIREVGAEIEPAEIERPVSGTIGGVRVRGIIDLIDINGQVIDLKVSGRKPATASAAHRLQVATYAAIGPAAAGAGSRVDTLVAKKAPELVRLAVESGDADRRMVERLYPHVQEGIREGLFFPNRGHVYCSRRGCAFWQACEAEYGGRVTP